jgi:acetyltransferase-like isoleucine patch superfamily enzyme
MFIAKSWAISLLGRFYQVAKNCALSQREEGFRKGFKSIGIGVEMAKINCSTCSRIGIGNYVYIGPGTNLVGRGGIEVEDHVIIGPEVVVMSSIHNWKGAALAPYDNVELLKPVLIGRASWVGYRALIMPGVKLGPGSIIGAGAVVTKDCPPGAVLAGNPARQISQRDMAQFEQCCLSDLFYLKRKQESGVCFGHKIERSGVDAERERYLST